MSQVKQKCDFCTKPAVYDAKTAYGPWAFMCEEHFELLASKVSGTYSRLEAPQCSKKVCSHCGVEKPLSEFYKYTDGRGVERYRTECKACNLASRKVQRLKKG